MLGISVELDQDVRMQRFNGVAEALEVRGPDPFFFFFHEQMDLGVLRHHSPNYLSRAVRGAAVHHQKGAAP